MTRPTAKRVRSLKICASPRCTPAAELVERNVSETLTYYAFPDIHWHKIRTTDEIDKSFLLDLLFWREDG